MIWYLAHRHHKCISIINIFGCFLISFQPCIPLFSLQHFNIFVLTLIKYSNLELNQHHYKYTGIPPYTTPNWPDPSTSSAKIWYTVPISCRTIFNTSIIFIISVSVIHFKNGRKLQKLTKLIPRSLVFDCWTPICWSRLVLKIQHQEQVRRHSEFWIVYYNLMKTICHQFISHSTVCYFRSTWVQHTKHERTTYWKRMLCIWASVRVSFIKG